MKDVRVEEVRGIAPQLERNPVPAPHGGQRVAKIGEPARLRDLLEGDERCQRHEAGDDDGMKPPVSSTTKAATSKTIAAASSRRAGRESIDMTTG